MLKRSRENASLQGAVIYKAMIDRVEQFGRDGIERGGTRFEALNYFLQICGVNR